MLGFPLYYAVIFIVGFLTGILLKRIPWLAMLILAVLLVWYTGLAVWVVESFFL